MTKAPCYRCEERHTACWGTCEKYKEWSKKIADASKVRRGELKTAESIWKVRGK